MATMPVVDLTAYAKAQLEKEQQAQQTLATISSRVDEALAIARDVQNFVKQNLPVKFPDPLPDESLGKIDSLRPLLDDVHSTQGRLEARLQRLEEILSVKA
jgi:hypothetical protein